MNQLDNNRVDRLSYFMRGSVKRATIHESKGLEFPIVFLVGLSLHAFTTNAWIRSEDDIESAIGSLLYVGMTRARDRLFLSFAGEPIGLLCRADQSIFEIDEKAQKMLTD